MRIVIGWATDLMAIAPLISTGKNDDSLTLRTRPCRMSRWQIEGSGTRARFSASPLMRLALAQHSTIQPGLTDIYASLYLNSCIAKP
jgi:hypothetical protein